MNESPCIEALLPAFLLSGASTGSSSMLLTRAGSSTLATPPAAVAVPPAGVPAGAAGGPGSPAHAQRERVRGALLALVQSNAFVDLVTQELQRTGLLR